MDAPTIDRYVALTDELPSFKKQRVKIEEHLQKWRESHPTYGERVRRLRKQGR